MATQNDYAVRPRVTARTEMADVAVIGARTVARPAAGGSLVLREANATDLDRVVPLFDAYREFYGATADPGATRAFLQARHAQTDCILIVAEQRMPGDCAGTVVGFTQLFPSFSSVSLRPIYILNDLFVTPAARRGNVARRLIATGVSAASERGAIRVELATQITNTPARSLYDSLGFVPDAEFVHLAIAT